jgi:ribosomal protein S18 acetylase RimI-like enzyme
MVNEVVHIHLTGMGYTLNAQLGKDHLRYLYSRMSADPDCYVAVALVDGHPAGVVSGSADAASFASKLIATMPAGRLFRTAIRIELRPRPNGLSTQGISITRQVLIADTEVRAVLTAIVVSTGVQGAGIGRALVGAFEMFLREAGVRSYRLDTLISNRRANKFYRDLGFAEVARRAGSVIFVRNVPA